MSLYITTFNIDVSILSAALKEEHCPKGEHITTFNIDV